jgi:hypothetical protein
MPHHRLSPIDNRTGIRDAWSFGALPAGRVECVDAFIALYGRRNLSVFARIEQTTPDGWVSIH